MAKKTSKTKANYRFPKRVGDVPATHKHLELLRGEFKSEITSLRLEMKSGFSKVDARFNEVDSRFSQIDARFNEVDSRFSQIDARFNEVDARFKQIDARFDRVDSQFKQVHSNFEKLNTTVFEMKVMMEEQNQRNKLMFEGYSYLFDFDKERKKRIEALEERVFGIRQK